MKKPSLSVAIPVYNEEANIGDILQSLLAQKILSFVLKDISVYSDCSTDRTHEIVTTFAKRSSKVKLVKSTQRKGKYYRMGQMFKNNTSDVLIVLDADIALEGKNFLELLAKKTVKDPKAKMVAAHQILLRPKTLIGKILHTHFQLWDFIRWRVPGYQNANCFYGSATAFSGDYARGLRFPKNIIDPHMFLYLMAQKHKGFRYARTAVMYQQTISTWSDFNKLLNRTLGQKDVELERLFDVDTETEHLIPRKYKIQGLMESFRKQPIYTIPALLLIVYMKVHEMTKTEEKKLIWDIVTSTKKRIPHATT